MTSPAWDLDGKRNKLYGRRWRGERGAFLQDHPLCVMCSAEGRITSATVVDHVVPHRGDETLFWDKANWQALCRKHHNSHKAREEIRGYSDKVGADGWPVDPHHPANTGTAQVSGRAQPEELLPMQVPVMLVCGAPGSGKTTWCNAQAGPDDLGIDFDEIDQRLNGVARKPWRLIVPILRERNRMLLAAADRKVGKVYLPISLARQEKVNWWKRKLRSVTVVTMRTPIDECISRIERDKEREAVAAELIQRARAWCRSVDIQCDEEVMTDEGGHYHHEITICGHRRPHPGKCLLTDQAVTGGFDDGFVL